MRALPALLLLFFAGIAVAQQRPAPRESAPATSAEAVWLIFNHGTTRPQRRHQCSEERDVPAVVRDVAAANNWSVQYLCSAATDDGVDGS